jgi:ATP-dependent RNA helicase DeaD
VNPDIYSIVFCRTRRETKEIADKLIEDGYNADALHGDLSQAQRDMVMQKFRNKNLQILVATDVAARGLDVNDLTHVINYKLPDQAENYTHRSGRTGRAGKLGISIAIITSKERNKLTPIERKIKKKFVQTQVPNGKEICEIQLYKLIDKVHDIEINEKEIKDYLPDIYGKLQELDREELIKRFVSIEFNQFLSYYQNARDLNNDDKPDKKRSGDETLSRFYVNLGKMDDLTPARLIGLINENLKKRDVEIGQIEILKSFSFFEIDKNYSDDILEKMNGAEFNNRRVIIELTAKPKGGRTSRGSKGFGRKDTSGSRKEFSRGRKEYGGGRKEFSGERKKEFSAERKEGYGSNKKPGETAGPRRRRR